MFNYIKYIKDTELAKLEMLKQIEFGIWNIGPSLLISILLHSMSLALHSLHNSLLYKAANRIPYPQQPGRRDFSMEVLPYRDCYAGYCMAFLGCIRRVLLTILDKAGVTVKALIVIDYTVDFVTGKLPCGQPAIDIEPKIAALTEQFAAAGDFVVMAVDLHEHKDLHHPEQRLFPPHNIRGTEGRTLYGKLNEVFQANKDFIYWMDKTRYSAFCGTDLELKLRERHITEIHLIGVCTDICVLHTAVDAYNKGFEVYIHREAVASFNQAGHEWALQHFEHVLGAAVV
ncbi:MAG: isochorismatase [Paenibacillus sp.]|jgi:nicotinamidase-related amidase|nr:isochorismatase [Paenibacillus sp.]